ncbi:MAG: hypothetical protein HFI28_15255 [Lachnospiraceae bacterium]|nr:hypothetical protein [Lachnospiraceae bacterium]
MNMIKKDDWRLRGQEEYLTNAKFLYEKFNALSQKGSHAHCEFCWHKFMENPEGIKDCSQEGYCTVDGKYWVCKDCFQDFQDEFNWENIN